MYKKENVTQISEAAGTVGVKGGHDSELTAAGFIESRRILRHIDEIVKTVHTKMDSIAQKMLDISVYLRDSEELNKKVYQPLIREIHAYFNYLNSLSNQFDQLPPDISSLVQKHLYEEIFLSLNQSKPIELLFCAQNLDADLLLACARRANLCAQENKQRYLFLCDMNLCRELIRHQVVIGHVVNLGIMHHYVPVDLERLLDKPNNTNGVEMFFDEHIKKAVLDVLELIPRFIEVCLPQTEKTKVVLRSCYGAGLRGEEKIAQVPQCKGFPITINLDFLPQENHKNLQVKSDDALKEHIVIQQTIINEQYQTKLVFPMEGLAPLELSGFPGLTSSSNFELFAKKLVSEWPRLTEGMSGLHVDPYSIHIYPPLAAYKGSLQKAYTQGLKNFKTVFINTLWEWEEGKTKLSSSKTSYQCLFTTATNLVDQTSIPEGSYGERLLNRIKKYLPVECFKVYCADYRAGYGRTITEMTKKGGNASAPKAITVGRSSMWGNTGSNRVVPTEDEQTECGVVPN